MAAISNTGKTVTVAFTVEETATLRERGGEHWKWQVPEFRIDNGGIGHLALRADMMEGRKLGLMSSPGTVPERWMMVIPSKILPLVPLFSKVQVSAIFPEGNAHQTEFVFPRSLPALGEKRAQMAKLGKSPKEKPKAVQTVPVVISEPVPTPQQRNGSNVTLLIEGKSFRYDIPIEERIRLIGMLAPYSV